MGLIRLLTPGRKSLPESVTRRAYISGMDEIPWPCRIVATEDGLIIDRANSESCVLRLPWGIGGIGEWVLATGSLLEREKPYLLEVELARGTLNRIRNQLATWESSGMKCPHTLLDQLAESTRLFAEAATSQDDPSAACEKARQSLNVAIQLVVGLGQAYAQQAMIVRHRAAPKLATLLGANLGTTHFDEDTARHYLSTFNSAVVPMRWSDVEVGEGSYNWNHTDLQLEWCETHKIRVATGPLLSFDRWSMPDWIYLFEGESDTIASLMEKYIQSIVERYQGRVNVWQCAARMNSGDCLGLNDEIKFQLALRAMQIVRTADPRTPLVVSFDMPWGEYVKNDMDLPLHLADALVRANLGLSGLGLEINVGYSPDGTMNRDPLEVSRQIDRWSLLGLPLLITLSVPGGSGPDEHARRASEPMPTAWPVEQQSTWVRQIVPILMAKQSVQGLFWHQFRDDESHDFPHGGLLDASGQPKPALKDLAALRAQHLG